jgi:proteasome assembly chaperone (PAC2) family protein
VKVVDGVVEEVARKGNEFFHGETEGGGVVVFIGHEPHGNVELYAKAFFDVVEELGVRRVVGLAGVYAPVPYEEDRDLVCVYSLAGMREELRRYGFRFSEYSSGSTIGMYLAKEAQRRGIEFVRLTAMVPAYDLSKGEILARPLLIEYDHKAWHDVLVRVNSLCSLRLDLSELEERSRELVSDWDRTMTNLTDAVPELDVEGYMEEMRAEFAQKSYGTLDELWEEELAELFEDEEEQGGEDG